MRPARHAGSKRNPFPLPLLTGWACPWRPRARLASLARTPNPSCRREKAFHGSLKSVFPLVGNGANRSTKTAGSLSTAVRSLQHSNSPFRPPRCFRRAIVPPQPRGSHRTGSVRQPSDPSISYPPLHPLTCRHMPAASAPRLTCNRPHPRCGVDLCARAGFSLRDSVSRVSNSAPRHPCHRARQNPCAFTWRSAPSRL